MEIGLFIIIFIIHIIITISQRLIFYKILLVHTKL